LIKIVPIKTNESNVVQKVKVLAIMLTW